MNILLLSYIMNACCMRLRYHKMHIYIYIIEWKMVEILNIYIYIYKIIFNNTLNFKVQLITYI